VKGDILTTFDPNDKLIFVARMLMLIVSCFTTPLLALPLRSIVHSLIKVPLTDCTTLYSTLVDES
jgi:hypothetical protein